MTKEKMKAPYTIFGKTKMVPVRTWTNNKEDIPAKESWDEEMWIERGEDWYGLMSHKLKGKTVRVIEREVWLRSSEAK